jgi:hypothetical protein
MGWKHIVCTTIRLHVYLKKNLKKKKLTNFTAKTIQADDQDVGGSHTTHRLLTIHSKLQRQVINEG